MPWLQLVVLLVILNYSPQGTHSQFSKKIALCMEIGQLIGQVSIQTTVAYILEAPYITTADSL